MKEKSPNIDEFDLNLLGIFEAVYKFGSVTRAAESLNCSGPSISQSLQKLRAFFSDPLFVRNGTRLMPTTMAEAIHMQLSKKYDALLDELGNLLTETKKNILKVHCPVYLSLRFVPRLAHWIEKHMPGCRVVYSDFIRHQDSSEDLLLQRGADLVFDIVPVYNFALHTLAISAEDMTFFCRSGHPRLGSHLSHEEAMLETFTMLDSSGLDVQLNQLQVNMHLGERNFSFISGSLLTIISVVAATDTIGIIPTWLYETFRPSFDIRALESNVKLTPIPVYMMYSKTSLQNTLFKNLACWLESDFSPTVVRPPV